MSNLTFNLTVPIISQGVVKVTEACIDVPDMKHLMIPIILLAIVGMFYDSTLAKFIKSLEWRMYVQMMIYFVILCLSVIALYYMYVF